jgi:hypothetical protein
MMFRMVLISAGASALLLAGIVVILIGQGQGTGATFITVCCGGGMAAVLAMAKHYLSEKNSGL